jgi:hypothetical protein
MSDRNTIIQEILSDKELMEKYNISEKELTGLTTGAPYHKKIIEIIATIINENDNHLSSSMIYKKLKNIHKI